MAKRVSSVSGMYRAGTIMEAMAHPMQNRKTPSQRLAGTFTLLAVLISKKDSRKMLPQVNA